MKKLKLNPKNVKNYGDQKKSPQNIWSAKKAKKGAFKKIACGSKKQTNFDDSGNIREPNKVKHTLSIVA